MSMYLQKPKAIKLENQAQYLATYHLKQLIHPSLEGKTDIQRKKSSELTDIF